MTSATRSTERDKAYHGIFVTAMEGGVNYWAYVNDYHWALPRANKNEEWVEDLGGFGATLVDAEDRTETHDVDRAVISHGVRNFIKYAKEKGFGEYWMAAARDLDWAKWDDLDYDAGIADAIVQFGLFGELVYG